MTTKRQKQTYIIWSPFIQLQCVQQSKRGLKTETCKLAVAAALYSCHHMHLLFNHEAASRHQPYATWKCNLRNVGCLIKNPPPIYCFLVGVGVSIPIVNSWNPILDTIPCLLDKVRTLFFLAILILN